MSESVVTPAQLHVKHEAEKVGDTYFLDPRDIQLPDEDLRGRKFPPTKTDVKELAESIMRQGQEEPVKCRLNGDGKPILVFGRTRYEAVLLINTELDPKNPRKIAARITTQDEKSAFFSCNEENKRRKNTSPVDEAFNHQVMRERFSMKDVEIAKDCGVTQAWVSKLHKLTTLPKDVLKQVHDGNLTFSTAISMADLEEGKQKEIAAKAKEDADKAAVANPGSAAATAKASGKRPKRPDSSVSEGTKKAVRAAKSKKAAKDGEEVATVQNLSTKEIRAFFQDLSEKYESEPITAFCRSALRFCSGKDTDRQFENAVMRLAQCGMKKPPEKADGVAW